jgi:hypothetical protein
MNTFFSPYSARRTAIYWNWTWRLQQVCAEEKAKPADGFVGEITAPETGA